MRDQNPIRIQDGVRSRALDDELVLYNPTTDAVTRLDAVGSIAWKLLEEPLSLADLISDLAEIYQMDSGAIAADVEQLVAGLLEARLVTNVASHGEPTGDEQRNQDPRHD